jgi:hypothetical protein
MADKLLARWRKIRNSRRKRAQVARKALTALNASIEKLNRTIAKRKAKLGGGVPGMNPGGWHPDAIETQAKNPLAWSAGSPKIVWHTTEGFGLPMYNSSQPHFTLNPKTGTLWQHVPIRGGAYALRNTTGGVETNRAHAIQVELIGFARESHLWSDDAYRNIAKLARWIEKHAGVPRQCTVVFRSDSNHKVPDYTNYTGHLGHQHVPENDHWDPGLFQIRKVV